jgi:signal transduction histidine kinase
MAVQISCPQCSRPVNQHTRHCEHCGVDLAVAAVLAERDFAIQNLFFPGFTISPEALVPRLGDYLIEKGTVKPEDLQRALNYQRKREAEGKSLLIGQALIELGLIDRISLDAAVTEQILQLQLALEHANRQLEQRVKERTAELQRALNKLAELNQLKSNFISNISHELRTPLTHLKGYLDIFTDQSLGPLNPQQLEALSVLKRAENRLERLIDDLIQFSLAARGELSLQIRPFRIEELIRQVASESAYKARANEIKMSVRIPRGLPSIQADQDKISWVLMQLLDNAIKFTTRGGQVGIDARLEQKMVRVTVRDTGIGIPAERISEIFEPFHQLDGSGTRRYAGTGLGLAMVSRILEAHGGSIKVDSTVGKGSNFYFSLPISKNSHV